MAAGSIVGDALRGAISGGVAVWVMDLVTTGYQASEPAADRRREEAARPNGQSSVANLVDRIDAQAGLGLDAPAKSRATNVVHYALGVVPGALYGALRGRIPGVGAGRGLLYGGLLFAVNDEYANTALGLAGPPEAYPVGTHARGAVGHLVLGAITDTGIDVLGG